jgi:hypothetical protein
MKTFFFDSGIVRIQERMEYFLIGMSLLLALLVTIVERALLVMRIMNTKLSNKMFAMTSQRLDDMLHRSRDNQMS